MPKLFDVLKRQPREPLFRVLPNFSFVKYGKCKRVCSAQNHSKLKHLAGHARFRAGFDFLLLRENQVMRVRLAWDSGGKLTKLNVNRSKRTQFVNINRQRSKIRRKAVKQVLMSDCKDH